MTNTFLRIFSWTQNLSLNSTLLNWAPVIFTSMALLCKRRPLRADLIWTVLCRIDGHFSNPAVKSCHLNLVFNDSLSVTFPQTSFHSGQAVSIAWKSNNRVTIWLQRAGP